MAGLLSLSQTLASKTSELRSEVALLDLDPTNETTSDPNRSSVLRSLRLQYFPENIEDSKEINYQRVDIPGGSLPLYQWMNSGERSISFTASFSTDVDYLIGGAGDSMKSVESRINAANQNDRNVSIPAAQAWLNRFMYPSYASSDALTTAPRRLLLVIPGSGIGVAGGGPAVTRDSVVCVMTACAWSMLKYFPSGLPRYATCQITLAQIPQKGGLITFPSTADMDAEVDGNRRTVAYKMKRRALLEQVDEFLL